MGGGGVWAQESGFVGLVSRDASCCLCDASSEGEAVKPPSPAGVGGWGWGGGVLLAYLVRCERQDGEREVREEWSEMCPGSRTCLRPPRCSGRLSERDILQHQNKQIIRPVSCHGGLKERTNDTHFFHFFFGSLPWKKDVIKESSPKWCN